MFTDQSEFLVMRTGNVTAKTALMGRTAIHVKKTSTITRFASLAIVIQLVSLPDLLDVDPSQSASYVNARKGFKDEFAINVDHFTGISQLLTKTVVKSVIALQVHI